MRATTVALAVGTAWVALGCAGARPPALELWTDPTTTGQEIARLDADASLPSEPRTRLRFGPNAQGVALELTY